MDIHFNIASKVKLHAQQAIQSLAQVFDITDINQFKEYERVQQAICRIISEIDASLLLPIYDQYPELSDLEYSKATPK
ncbi:MAG: hypothetical protein WDW20_06280 [Neisseriaceae bacterium]